MYVCACIYASKLTVFAGVLVANQTLVRAFSVTAQRRGYSKSSVLDGPDKLLALLPVRAHTQTHYLSASSAEYVNALELPTDMKSITDRAAQTLLWTELFRGQWVRVSLSLSLSASARPYPTPVESSRAGCKNIANSCVLRVDLFH